MTRIGNYLWLPVLLLLAMLQTALFSYLRVLGVTVQAIVVVTLAWALWHGASEGLAWAFGGGLLIDLLSTGPLGVSSAALMLGVLAMSPLLNNLSSGRLLLPLLLGALGTLTFQLGSVLFLSLAGYAIPADALSALAPTVLVHTLLIVPIFWLVQAAERRLLRGRRVQL